MNKQQIKAIRVLAPVVRKMLRTDPDCQAVLVADHAGYRVEWIEEDGERHSRGWMFNSGGPGSDRRNLLDVRRWCGGAA